ncbi:MAG: glycosyltransferase family 2 protein [Lachnospiraceae bacterium]|nr:glycosyltransferase family 2 protein [Lachnospiraceae bacterium]
MKMRLQEILFPKKDEYARAWKLFYHGMGVIYRDRAVKMAPCSQIDYMSYFNAFSLEKWKTYTCVKNISLVLIIEGAFRIRLVGYSLNVCSPVRTVLGTYDYDLKEKTEIRFEYPKTEDTMLAFEIETNSVCKLYSGGYEGECDSQKIQEVNLFLATTTFKKETFIERNLELLKEEILNTQDEMKENFSIHVIDNGRTLEAEKLEQERVFIHSNKNVGGSGGFARGMIEALKSEKIVTHILLMDDDILILPESIKRTYRLLKVLKPEYRERFISGAMLCYEQMNIQHEDIGFVHKDGSYGPLKGRLDHNFVVDNLRCEKEYLPKQDMYAGWWYCCIPMEAIKKNGLPLPLFVRGDDVEFSLRNHAGFITMNGISVWHLGFTYKFNAAVELYQVHRNSLILQAVSGVCQNIDFMDRMRKLFRARILSLDYSGAELILDAIEDFLKGPAFIQQDCGEHIMKEKASKNEAMKPLKEFSNIDIDLDTVYYDPPRGFARKWLYRLTYNGHRFCPSALLRKGPGIVAYDWFYSPEHNFWRKELLAVNPHLETGHLRIHSKKKYRTLLKRYKELIRQYHAAHIQIEEQYKQAYDFLRSIDFWESYLEI